MTLSQAYDHAQMNEPRMGSRKNNETQKDSSQVSTAAIDPKLYMWSVDERLGNRQMIPADTIYHNFQNENLVEGMTGHNNYLGNLGSPSMSRIFFDRPVENSQYLFIDPYSSFFVKPQNFICV